MTLKNIKLSKILEVASVVFFAGLSLYATYQLITGTAGIDPILLKYAASGIFFWIYHVHHQVAMANIENKLVLSKIDRAVNMLERLNTSRKTPPSSGIMDKLKDMGLPMPNDIIEVQLNTRLDEDGNLHIDDTSIGGSEGANEHLQEFLNKFLGIKSKKKQKVPSEMSVDELRNALQEALKKEDYESASLLRKLIEEKEKE